MIELSNYWDDFELRVNSTIDCLKQNRLPKLERLTVHLTDQCNFRCSYCNMHFSRNTMSKDLAFKIVNEYAAMGGNIIHFTGGEPSVVPYIQELFKHSKNQGLQVSSNTNAYKRMNTKYIDKLKCSFDTPIATDFNKTMGVNSFEQVVDNMKYYSDTMQDKMLSITAVLNKNTYKTMLDLARFVQENFSVYNLYYSNYKGDNKDFAFSDDQITDMFQNYIPKTLDYFRAANNRYSLNQLSLYKPTDFINSDCRFETNKTTPCFIQLSEMTIDVSGGCHNCSHLYRDGIAPVVNVSVTDKSVGDCFNILKGGLNGNYTYLSSKCLNGCNTNLIGFNKAVEKQEYIGSVREISA